MVANYGFSVTQSITAGRAWSRPFRKKKIVYFFMRHLKTPTHYSLLEGAWIFYGAWMLALGTSMLGGGSDAVTLKNIDKCE